jgi:hypothetical protein
MENATQSLTAASLGIDVSRLPALLDADGIHSRVAPIGRTVLYEAATREEIKTVLLGAPGKRGKRLFVTDSVIAWILRRATTTKPPAMGSRKKSASHIATA